MSFLHQLCEILELHQIVMGNSCPFNGYYHLTANAPRDCSSNSFCKSRIGFLFKEVHTIIDDSGNTIYLMHK
uniref:Uncharacterized protein n=1 Tax=Lepeophtheirus salmonis TaxID=72036 RepID=A0A0K2SZP6_LEPSM